MHVADGILSGPIIGAGFAGAAVITALTMRKMDLEEIPKISVATAVFFVASLIHIPIGPTSVHLLLNGLVGILLGWRAFPAILLGIILQAILFGHGGVTVIGVNTVMLGGGALFAYGVWQLRHKFSFAKKETVFGGLAGATATITSGIVLASALVTTGDAFVGSAKLILYYHIPIMLIEGTVAAVTVSFLLKVKPGILAGQVKPVRSTG
jgi:cobalt/nickel transport system permease protein